MFVPCGSSAPPDFEGFTLLLPAVSVGNVGQLAVDLVIFTLDMPKVGYFYTDCLVPMVGNNPYATAEENSTELSINAEVYSLPSKKLVVLQIRSPFVKNKYRSFCQTLLSWVKSSRCAKVILLSSSHAYQCDDQQLHGCSNGIQMAVLLKFCSEGDNIPDALALVNYLNEWLQLVKSEQNSTAPATPSQWKIPHSWRLLFGSGLPPALF
ncbi:proteasome assembly chaperone 2 isoform X4 [Gopherus flavomarginatus]|uniref:proteasome assembly chaperone 2 isoform X4 n=1 Tax=Gopherus flavomarginatus TaxID=286002 RepID=UPI0021CBCC26|nr:proteasome assembly chaperone 2 isoform X4 [Gopherus flavomarginatus]